MERAPAKQGPRDKTRDGADNELTSRLRLVTTRLARRLRQQGTSHITHSQLSALATIDRHGPLTLGEVAAIENVQPPSVSRIVGALEGEGYVERTISTKDRRQALVRATPSGRRVLEDIRSARDAWLARQLGTFGPADLRSIEAAIPILERLLQVEAIEPATHAAESPGPTPAATPIRNPAKNPAKTPAAGRHRP